MGPVRKTGLFADLTPHELYGILRVRLDVFVVEQDCAYPELDGRDTEPTTLHLWQEQDRQVLSTIRLLHNGEHRSIGRVATAKHARGRGLSGDLLREGIRLSEGRRVDIGAQAYLEAWYSGFGFTRSGPDYLEDGIPHLPMSLSA